MTEAFHHTSEGMMSEYRITNQRQLRREFWETFPGLPRRKIKDYSGTGKMYPTDTRVTCENWLDALCYAHWSSSDEPHKWKCTKNKSLSQDP